MEREKEREGTCSSHNEKVMHVRLSSFTNAHHHPLCQRGRDTPGARQKGPDEQLWPVALTVFLCAPPFVPSFFLASSFFELNSMLT